MKKITKVYGIKTKRDINGVVMVDKETKKPITRRTYIGYLESIDNGKVTPHFDFMPMNPDIELQYEVVEGNQKTNCDDNHMLPAKDFALSEIRRMFGSKGLG